MRPIFYHIKSAHEIEELRRFEESYNSVAWPNWPYNSFFLDQMERLEDCIHVSPAWSHYHINGGCELLLRWGSNEDGPPVSAWIEVQYDEDGHPTGASIHHPTPSEIVEAVLKLVEPQTKYRGRVFLESGLNGVMEGVMKEIRIVGRNLAFFEPASEQLDEDDEDNE